MKTETPGITKAADGLEGIVWNILGQIYVPKSCTDAAFAWHATFPPGTFVPPHAHDDQDEYLYILEGRLDFWLEGEELAGLPGDTIRLAKGRPHGIFNKSGETVTCLFWVAPTAKLFDLFVALDAMDEQAPDEVVKISAGYGIHFLPPPPA